MTNNDLSLEQTINKNESPDLLTALAAQNNGSQHESIKEHMPSKYSACAALELQGGGWNLFSILGLS